MLMPAKTFVLNRRVFKVTFFDGAMDGVFSPEQFPGNLIEGVTEKRTEVKEEVEVPRR